MRYRPRKIVVDGVRCEWKRSHGHRKAGEKEICHETVTAWREGRSGAYVTIRFVNGESDGHTTAGQGWGGGLGLVLVDDLQINLNLPSVVSELIRGARAMRGWDPDASVACVIEDGFTFVRELLARDVDLTRG